MATFPVKTLSLPTYLLSFEGKVRAGSGAGRGAESMGLIVKIILPHAQSSLLTAERLPALLFHFVNSMILSVFHEKILDHLIT